MQEQCKIERNPFEYCCPAKQYYSKDAGNLGNALKILPRVVIYKNSFKVNNTYESTLKIVNQGPFKRQLLYTTDSSDTDIQICPTELKNNFLQPNESLKIYIRITPNTKSNINRRRHVFITSQHPNITFSIPIIILFKSDENVISLPLCLTFPPVTVEHFSYYKMIIYNKSVKKLQFSIKCPLSNLSYHTKSCDIMRKDYGEILLKLYCKGLENIDNRLRLKFNTGEKFDIAFNHVPLRTCLFVHTLNINFDCVRFKRRKTQEFAVCNESNKDVVFDVKFVLPAERKGVQIKESHLSHQNAENDSANVIDCKQTRNIDNFSYKHFIIEPSCGTILKNSSCSVKIHFCPVVHNNFSPNENDFPPFRVSVSVSISCKNELETERRNICLRGQIIGPEISISPKVLDIGNIYFGEEHFAEIIVQNVDDLCDASVNLCDLSHLNNFRVTAKPKDGLVLKPNQKDVFHIQFYATTIWRFIVKLEFKVQNGGRYSMLIKGCSRPVRVICPKILNLGVIPIALPQKRLILLMNPLTIPITVQCSVREDGSETPLVLNVRDTGEQLPITVKVPADYLEKSYDCNQESLQIEKEVQIRYDIEEEVEEETSLISVHSQSDDNTSCSTEFEKSALDLIPDMSRNFVSYLKTMQILDKREMEKDVIEEALNALLKTPYFRHMDKCRSYTQMDWNFLPTDPQEIYCNTEIIHLKPGTGKAISIVVVPNVLGCHLKYLELRVCPLLPAADSTAEYKQTIDYTEIVKTDFMTSKLFIAYNCSVPEIIWDNIITMEDKLYAGEYYDFEMAFENKSQFGGFFYYDVIPQSSLGTIKFPNKIWKYFIKPISKLHVPCQVTFTKLGLVSLCGCIKFVGVCTRYPFYIKAEVLPPTVRLFPRSICNTLPVLESGKFNIFIQNATPTTTWFMLKLKNDSSMSFEPCGGQLAPNGQTTYVTLTVWFRDPGIYKNTLYVMMEFGIVEEIPITITVKGMPIFFEPEICAKDLNMGHIPCTIDNDNCEDKKTFSKVIKVINKGLRSYRLSIIRTKNSAEPSCIISSSKVKLIIKPNNFIVTSLSETSFIIFLTSTDATSFYSEFRIQIAEYNDIKHMESHRFSLSAEFITPELSWNRRSITINYNRPHNHDGPELWENLTLTNITESYVENVKLAISGPFKIKELFEHKYEKQLHFSMRGLEMKEFFIALNKKELNNRSNMCYAGSISCSANLKVQRSVRLKVLVFVPEIILKHNEIIFFINKDECETNIELTNSGKVPAFYKWKKLKEEWHYISQEDDVKQVASLLLSDLLYMLELQTIDPELDSETNMTRRYKKYKCIIKELSDPLNIKEIIHEIIDSLDLNVKRYKLDYRTSVPFANHNLQLTPSDLTVATEASLNTKACVNYTLDDIVNHLNLEESCELLSVPSSETCEQGNSVYFFEKCGLLQENQSEMCALHIPPIRKGFEVRATFQLDVAGGKTQKLEIVLVNLDKTITLNKQLIYLGHKPWYERYFTKSYIGNITNYQLRLRLHPIPTHLEQQLPKLALGFNNIIGNKILQLSPLQNTILKTEGIMGFNEDFNREISIVVNDNQESILKLYGHGAMPMLTISESVLPILEEELEEVYEDYQLLQKLFHFDIFKTITEQEEEFLETLSEQEIEEQDVQDFMTEFTLPSSTTDEGSAITKSALEFTRDQHFSKLMRNYVIVNNNEDVPNYKVLDQLMQTQKFLNRLRRNRETSALLGSLYHNYLLHFKNNDGKILSNLKHFEVQSLPFHLKTSILDMGKVYLNRYCKFIVELDFYGPGKLIVAARTAVKIPGLVIDFQVFEKNEDNFIYYRAENTLTSCDKPYRNINERFLDGKMNPKVTHAHSYDLNLLQQHQRVISIKHNKCLKDYSNSFNKSMYSEQKHHFVQCKIAGNRKNGNAAKIHIILLFRPKNGLFRHNQNVEDYLYIDLHMGTTLPILLRALVVDADRKDNL